MSDAHRDQKAAFEASWNRPLLKDERVDWPRQQVRGESAASSFEFNDGKDHGVQSLKRYLIMAFRKGKTAL